MPAVVVVAALALAIGLSPGPSARAQGPEDALPSGGAAAPGGQTQPAPPSEGATGREVPAQLNDASDRAIAQRLRATFAGVEALQGVQVAVNAGVVRLGGEVGSAAARELAGQLARQVEGVALVENEIRLSQDLGPRLKAAWTDLRQRLYDLLALAPLLVLAASLVLLAWYAGGLLARPGWPYRGIDNAFLRNAARQLVRVVVLLAGALLALEILDATALVAALLGTAGLFGLVLGLAFRDLAENAIASLLLSLRQPFAPNDLIRVADHEGHVVRLTSRATVLLTVEGNHVRIPNAAVYKGVIVNYSRNPLRRFDFVVGLGMTEDLLEAQRLAVELLAGTAGVLADPAPQMLVEEIGASSVLARVTGWVDQRAADYLKVRSEAIRRLKEGFEAAGVSLPEPVSVVRLQRHGEAPPPAAPAQPAAPAGDVSRRDVVERQAAADRATSGPDLLDPDAPREL